MTADMIDAHTLWADRQAVSAQAPLVHSITNLVVMNFNANALLALGASPVMAHAELEVRDMVGIAQACPSIRADSAARLERALAPTRVPQDLPARQADLIAKRDALLDLVEAA